jgi:hypothetical protein
LLTPVFSICPAGQAGHTGYIATIMAEGQALNTFKNQFDFLYHFG